MLSIFLFIGKCVQQLTGGAYCKSLVNNSILLNPIKNFEFRLIQLSNYQIASIFLSRDVNIILLCIIKKVGFLAQEV